MIACDRALVTVVYSQVFYGFSIHVPTICSNIKLTLMHKQMFEKHTLKLCTKRTKQKKNVEKIRKSLHDEDS